MWWTVLVRNKNARTAAATLENIPSTRDNVLTEADAWLPRRVCTCVRMYVYTCLHDYITLRPARGFVASAFSRPGVNRAQGTDSRAIAS